MELFTEQEVDHETSGRLTVPNYLNNIMNKDNLINSFFANWNPLEVPPELAETEYIGYVDLVMSNIHSKAALYKCLTKILGKTMGLNVSSPHIKCDIERACNELMKVFEDNQQITEKNEIL